MITGLEKIIKNKPPQVKELRIGMVGWCVPWAVCILKNGDVFLNRTYLCYPNTEGATTLKITKVENGFDLDFTLVESFERFAQTLDEITEDDPDDIIENWVKVGNVSEEFKRESKGKVKA
jgi:hypothetical protein